MDAETRLCQLAIRGAAELPNDPFQAIAQTDLRDARKLKAAERRKLSTAERSFSAHLLAMYTAEDDHA